MSSRPISIKCVKDQSTVRDKLQCTSVYADTDALNLPILSQIYIMHYDYLSRFPKIYFLKYKSNLSLVCVLFQLLKMHYVGENTSMLIVLPNEINGLNGVLKKLADGFDLMSEVNQMFNTKVQVTIPKFKIETEIDLAEVLPKVFHFIHMNKFTTF